MSFSEWKEYQLKDLIINHSSKRIPLSSRERESRKGVYPYYGAQGIIDSVDDYIFEGEYLLVAEDGNNLKERKADIAQIAKGKFWVNNHAHVISNNHDSDMRFIKYYLNRIDLGGYITGTAQPKLNKANLESIRITAPLLEEQKAIANILSSLDEKIELNNQMNKTLEEMAQALFKRWFVDFEFPNENGEPYKSSGGEMVDSELGMIPKGWEVTTIGDLGRVVTGKTPSTKEAENFGEEFNFITPRDINGNIFIQQTERKLSLHGASKIENYKVKPYSIGVSCIGSDLGEVYVTDDVAFTNQQINTLELREVEKYPYMYILLKNMKSDFKNIAGGSAVPIINKTSFSNITVLIPQGIIMDEFNKSVWYFLEQIKEKLKENSRLIQIRDTLLPKLMSGEIRVADLQN